MKNEKWKMKKMKNEKNEKWKIKNEKWKMKNEKRKKWTPPPHDNKTRAAKLSLKIF